MKRKLVYIPVIIIITGLILTFSLIINNSVILTRIYYKINYKGNVQNFESIIEKSELFEYQKYCKYRDSSGEVHNVGDVDYLYRIDREFIESLKLQIEDDKKRFHFYPSYSRSFVYSVEVTNESLIYLTFTTIIQLLKQSMQTIQRYLLLGVCTIIIIRYIGLEIGI
ncbi:hypothetical protein ES703_49592 [subsurface metagenome]